MERRYFNSAGRIFNLQESAVRRILVERELSAVLQRFDRERVSRRSFEMAGGMPSVFDISGRARFLQIQGTQLSAGSEQSLLYG